mmetsp:Transcript_15508/g.54107  ORF Transcript_15508/g.54107 Transcript_15508/m.54107 type:complete len:283 (+) Transcript_15508:163-1011(+)
MEKATSRKGSVVSTPRVAPTSAPPPMHSRPSECMPSLYAGIFAGAGSGSAGGCTAHSSLRYASKRHASKASAPSFGAAHGSPRGRSGAAQRRTSTAPRTRSRARSRRSATPVSITPPTTWQTAPSPAFWSAAARTSPRSSPLRINSCAPYLSSSDADSCAAAAATRLPRWPRTASPSSASTASQSVQLSSAETAQRPPWSMTRRSSYEVYTTTCVAASARPRKRALARGAPRVEKAPALPTCSAQTAATRSRRPGAIARLPLGTQSSPYPTLVARAADSESS